MRAKLRRQISARLKELKIPARLYRGSKFIFFRRYSGRELRRLLDFLAYSAPGTLVEDCDNFNHVVNGFLPHESFRHKYSSWYGKPIRGYFVDIDQVVFEDGRYSCGCPSPGLCPPRSREEIESDFMEHFAGIDMATAIDDWTKEPYDDLTKNMVSILRSGGHICDERGVLLPEFRK